MRDDIFDLGHACAQEFLDIGKILDPRGDEEALPAAVMLAEQRFADHHGIPGRDIGPHREAVDRRRLDHAEFTQPRHRHLQRARDRRRGEGQDMDVGLELLQPFLVDDAEALLLVDDDKAEILELDRFRDDGVRADDDIDRPGGQAVARLLRFACRNEPREAADIDREAFEALDKIRVMLAREQRRRDDHRNLHPRHRGDEGGAQRDLGLAETDVAAHEPVHRTP